MIRQGSILRFTCWAEPSDVRYKVIRHDAGIDAYQLQTTRGLVDCTIERWVLHSWLRNKVMLVETKGGPI